jgi:hypothetical protein
MAFLLSVGLARGAEADQWKGLVLNKSHALQAFETLGRPEQDETAAGALRFVPATALGEDYKRKPMRVLKFQTEDFKAVSLVFDEDVLIAIHLVPSKQNKIRADELSAIYTGVHFEESGNVMLGGDYEKRVGIIRAFVGWGRIVVELDLISSKIIRGGASSVKSLQ